MAGQPLPTELLEMIFFHALGSTAPPERTALRHSLALCSRTFYALVQPAKSLELVGLSHVEAVVDHIRANEAAHRADQRVRVLHTSLDSLFVSITHEGRRSTRQASMDAMCALLPKMASATSVELELGRYTFTDQFESIGHSLALALAHLGNTKHLTLTGKEGKTRPWFYTDRLNTFISAWPALESVTVRNCYVEESHPRSSPSIFSRRSQLHTLRLHSLIDHPTYANCLADLPASLRSLTLDGSSTYVEDRIIAAVKTKLMDKTAGQLTRFALLDTPPVDRRWESETSRGHYDELVPKLARVESLAINPCAVTNLAAALANLTQLSTLELEQGFAAPPVPFAAEEVCEFLGQSTALRRLFISGDIHVNWDDTRKDLVEQAAAKRHVRLRFGTHRPPEPQGKAPSRAQVPSTAPTAVTVPSTDEDEDEGDELSERTVSSLPRFIWPRRSLSSSTSSIRFLDTDNLTAGQAS